MSVSGEVRDARCKVPAKNADPVAVCRPVDCMSSTRCCIMNLGAGKASGDYLVGSRCRG